MGFAIIKKKAHDLFERAHFISHIASDDDYENALELMNELIEDYNYNRSLIEILAISIERWEDESKEFTEFNARIKSLDSGSAILKLLMEQHQLGVNDLPEIGSKSLISKIINNKRQLTLAHIHALKERFKVDPSLFF